MLAGAGYAQGSWPILATRMGRRKGVGQARNPRKDTAIQGSGSVRFSKGCERELDAGESRQRNAPPKAFKLTCAKICRRKARSVERQ